MRRARMLLVGIGIATAVAVTGTGIAAAAPAPQPGERVTTLQVPPIGTSPLLAAYFTVEAVTGRAPGVVLLRTVSECYVLNPISAQTCIPGPGNNMRANAVRVNWLNVNTGASGAATIPIGTVGSTDSPRPEIDVATGAGRIVVSTTAPAEYPQSLLPGFGTFDVP